MSGVPRKDGRLTWGESQFPILCETCLGDNPYLRMMVDRYGQECKVCNRPFVTYRWCPGQGMRYKRTEICQTCSRVKNVCQTCLLDLKYSLPVQARDELLQISTKIPRSDVNREYHRQILEKNSEGKSGEELSEQSISTSMLALPGTSSTTEKEQNPGSKMLAKLARRAPYYRRNLPHICSFYVKGICRRGNECPFRHEKPTDPDDPLSNQNIKDRYYGTKDPVAQRIIARAKEEEKKEKEENKTAEFTE